MARSGIQSITEMGIGAAQSGTQHIAKEIGAQTSQTIKTTGQQIGVLPTLDNKTLEEKADEQKKKDEEEIAKRKRELQRIEQTHRDEVDRLTQATTAPKPVPPQPEESTEPKRQVVPPLGQPLLPSSPERGSSFKPTKGKPFVGTTAIGTQEGGKRKG